ncbi:MAG: endonuclease III [Deltaproteobacteria bacterium]|nr:endonuclease III [Deltaproteobacteria bacterium]
MRRHAQGHRLPSLSMVAEQRRDPFLILTGCILSLRTKDETTLPAAERLFALADTPARLRRISVKRIERAIYPVGFYRTKARTLRTLAAHLLLHHAGKTPDTLEELLAIKGVGRKTANLVLTLGFGKPGICVDTHVHRISNRWGLVTTRTPEQTEMALREKLPRRYWIEYNDLLVTFGKTLCHPLSPKCSICPVRARCPRRGVKRSR